LAAKPDRVFPLRNYEQLPYEMVAIRDRTNYLLVVSARSNHMTRLANMTAKSESMMAMHNLVGRHLSSGLTVAKSCRMKGKVGRSAQRLLRAVSLAQKVLHALARLVPSAPAPRQPPHRGAAASAFA
jgi:hypothetical protein